MGRDLAIGKFPNAFLQLQLLLVQLEIQSPSGRSALLVAQAFIAELNIKSHGQVRIVSRM